MGAMRIKANTAALAYSRKFSQAHSQSENIFFPELLIMCPLLGFSFISCDVIYLTKYIVLPNKTVYVFHV